MELWNISKTRIKYIKKTMRSCLIKSNFFLWNFFKSIDKIIYMGVYLKKGFDLQ